MKSSEVFYTELYCTALYLDYVVSISFRYLMIKSLAHFSQFERSPSQQWEVLWLHGYSALDPGASGPGPI